MIISRLKARLPRRRDISAVELKAGAEAPAPAPVPGAAHDPMVRYATLGIFLILLIASLKIAQVVALPVTAGIILGLVLGPLADSISNRGVPRGLTAALIVISFVTLVLAAAGSLAVPVAVWSDQIPAMIGILRSKITGAFNLTKLLEDVTNAGGAAGPAKTVVVADQGSPALAIAVTSGVAAAGLLLTVFTMYFYLSTRRQIKAKALRLCLGHEARKSAGAFFDRIEERVAHYLLIVTVINALMGSVVGLISWAAGYSYPVAWAAFAAIMNYIPLIGPLIVTAALIAAGVLLEASALAALWPAALYFLCHVAEGEIATPALVGRRLTISPLMVFLSFAFWLWLWGPAGAILATPILLVFYVAREVIGEYRESVAPETAAETH